MDVVIPIGTLDAAADSAMTLGVLVTRLWGVKRWSPPISYGSPCVQSLTGNMPLSVGAYDWQGCDWLA